MGETRQAVILAAGQGARLRTLAPVKPLMPLLGMPLLERSIRTLQRCGIDEIVIVTGYSHETIGQWFDEWARRESVATKGIRLVHNQRWHDQENGASLLAAAPYINGRFLLLMADHVYVPELIDSLSRSDVPDKGVVLAVDGRIRRDDIDLEDVTRVQLEGRRIRRIGKGLEPHQAFDTGAFLCTPAVFDRMRTVIGQGKSRISDVMQALADEGLLMTHHIDGHYWQDVDTPATHAAAERGLLQWAAGKSSDGHIARRLNRPISRWFTQRFIAAGMTPNQVSLVAFGISCVAALLIALGHYWALALGGLLVQLASIVDGSDGELARVRLAPSEYGGWFDALLDRYADGFVLAALTWYAMQWHASTAYMWLGIAALCGSFVASYSAHKADRSLPPSRWRMGRDTRSLIIMVGALLNLPAVTLAVIAVIMNVAVVHRIVRMRDAARSASRGGVA